MRPIVSPELSMIVITDFDPGFVKGWRRGTGCSLAF